MKSLEKFKENYQLFMVSFILQGVYIVFVPRFFRKHDFIVLQVKHLHGELLVSEFPKCGLPLTFKIDGNIRKFVQIPVN